MSFLIKISDNNFNNILSYEEELILSVAFMNVIYIQNNKLDTTCLGCIGIKYKDYSAGTELHEIDHISKMIEQGYGKCDSIVAWFIAENYLKNIESFPLIVRRTQYDYHVLLRTKENNEVKVSDPSKLVKDRNFKNCERCRNK